MEFFKVLKNILKIFFANRVMVTVFFASQIVCYFALLTAAETAIDLMLDSKYFEYYLMADEGEHSAAEWDKIAASDKLNSLSVIFDDGITLRLKGGSYSVFIEEGVLPNNEAEEAQVVIGSALAKELGLSVGDKVEFADVEATVVGICEGGSVEINRAAAKNLTVKSVYIHAQRYRDADLHARLEEFEGKGYTLIMPPKVSFTLLFKGDTIFFLLLVVAAVSAIAIVVGFNYFSNRLKGFYNLLKEVGCRQDDIHALKISCILITALAVIVPCSLLFKAVSFFGAESSGYLIAGYTLSFADNMFVAAFYMITAALSGACASLAEQRRRAKDDLR